MQIFSILLAKEKKVLFNPMGFIQLQAYVFLTWTAKIVSTL